MSRMMTEGVTRSMHSSCGDRGVLYFSSLVFFRGATLQNTKGSTNKQGEKFNEAEL